MPLGFPIKIRMEGDKFRAITMYTPWTADTLRQLILTAPQGVFEITNEALALDAAQNTPASDEPFGGVPLDGGREMST